MRSTFAALFLSLALSASGLDFWDKGDPAVLAESLVNAMSVPELASQVLMLAFPDPVPDATILSWIENRSLGGVKYFGWNAGSPVQVSEASTLLQAHSQRTRFRIPLLVATDQEGGWVRHIKGITSTTPGNMSLGSGGYPADAFQTARLIGVELRQMGVNMNFAPSVDLYVNPAAHVIGPRSFGQDPVESGIMGMAFFRGLQSEGIIATAKHFPGHGNTDVDSHGRLPVIHDSLETLQKRELVPYKMMIAEGLPAIMSGHISFPEAAGDGLPASLSAKLVGQLLRKDLDFHGVVLTDDLYMEGARPNGWSIATAAEKSLEAGNDLLLISKPARAQFEAWDGLIARANRDAPFREALKASARRVLELKLRYLKGPGAVPLTSKPANLVIPARGSEPFIVEATARGAALVASGGLPWKTDGGAPLVVTPYEGAWRSVVSRFPGAALLEYNYDFFSTDAAVLQAMTARVAASKRTVFVLATPGGLGYLKAMAPWREKIAVVSVLSPVYLREVPWVKDAIAVFGTNAAAFDVAAAVLAGDLKPQGKLPFRFGDFPWARP